MGEKSPTDLMLHCPICKSSNSLSSVRDHKKHHSAMRVMRFKQGSGPRSLDSLSKRHRTLVRKVLAKQRECPEDSNLIKRLERISEAYESLRHEFTKDDSDLHALLFKDGKTSMRDGFFEERDRELEDEIEHEPIGTYKQPGYPSCVYGIGRSQAINRNWRDKMEDCVSIEEGVDVKSLNRPCLLGVFDGHHGSASAKTCSEKLGSFIFEEINGFRSNLNDDINSTQHKFSDTSITDDDYTDYHNPSDVDISNCITKAYQEMDRYLGHGISETSRVRWSGCSALTCLISDEVAKDVSISDKADEAHSESERLGSCDDNATTTKKNEKVGQVYISNVGNVQAVLYQNRKPLVLNRCHSLNDAEELKRVIKAGASVNSNEIRMKINGVMETTRGLGNHGDPKLKRCVIPIPQTSVVRLTDESQILVIASSNLWEVLNPHDVFAILLHYIPPDAMTVLKSGPIPIIPVMHGHFSADDRGDGDGHRLGLPSIVETEEDEAIEEVIFVHAEHSDSEDDDEKVTGAYGDSFHSDPNDGNSKAGTDDRKRENNGGMSTYSTDESSCGIRIDPSVEKDIIIRKQYSQVACDLSAHLVRAAIEAGARENVSAVVVLFEGLFN